MIQFKNERDFRKFRTAIKKVVVSAWSNNAGSQDHAIDEAYKSAVQTLRDIQNNLSNPIFNGNIKLTSRIFGKTRADGSNVLKAIEDGLQRVAYENDKQIKDGHFIFED